MIEATRETAQELTELVQRPKALQAPLRERLQACEGRIAELEKQLAKKGAKNRELIKTKIDLTRRQLKTERARTRVELNGVVSARTGLNRSSPAAAMLSPELATLQRRLLLLQTSVDNRGSTMRSILRLSSLSVSLSLSLAVR
ncbi:MAG TPA: hypothetical protein VI136_26800 [Verrucomicrobiae bacterium]